MALGLSSGSLSDTIILTVKKQTTKGDYKSDGYFCQKKLK